VYSDEDYFKGNRAFLNGTEADINTASGFLRIDFRPVKNLRVIAATRADKFSSPDDVYLAYEFAATYKINNGNLIRTAITRSNSGSFIGVNNLNLVVPVGPGVNLVRSGNKDVELLTVNMIEVGFRSQLSKRLQIDLDLFTQNAENFNGILVTGATTQQFRNVPTSARQIGVTFSLNFVPSERIQVKPFVTIQKTETEDLPSVYYDPAIVPITYSDSKHKQTPSVYGGYYFNYKVTERFNVNLNGYYFASHRQYHRSDLAYGSKAGDIEGVVLLNAKLNFSITKQINVFLNGRNITANSRQYFGTDKIEGVYMLGASFNLN